MNDVIDEAGMVDSQIRELLRAANAETKEAVLFDLIDELLAGAQDDPQMLINSSARAFRSDLVKMANGELYAPPTPEEIAEAERNRAWLREQFKWTPEEEAELERRRQTLDDVVEIDEVIRRLKTAETVEIS